jgi:hypothetical protein
MSIVGLDVCFGVVQWSRMHFSFIQQLKKIKFIGDF